MPSYHFDMESDGDRFESFGTVQLSDDAEAISFSKRVIRELLKNNPEQHALWRLNVTEGERLVARIPVECELGAKQNRVTRLLPTMWN